MRVDGYNIFMGAEHFSYKSTTIQTSSATESKESFKSDESSKSPVVGNFSSTSEKSENLIMKDLRALAKKQKAGTVLNLVRHT
ncbi:MAG: hypothetical protein Q8N78_06800 [Sulfurimonas sp.]|nr:hypothetical protein [Sulfurimonas sp.]